MNPLKSIGGTLTAGLILAILIMLFLPGETGAAGQIKSLVVWLHVFAGVTWIGLLYYFNFVQVPAVGDALADTDGPGPGAISKYVAPRALWWFRWGALFTWLSGATILHLMGQLHHAFTLGMTEGASSYATMIGVGAWLGTIMLFNVWVLIWPNQKKILGMVEATPDEIAKAKNIAFMASRSNTLMSIPMLMSMVGPGHGWFM